MLRQPGSQDDEREATCDEQWEQSLASVQTLRQIQRQVCWAQCGCSRVMSQEWRDSDVNEGTVDGDGTCRGEPWWL